MKIFEEISKREALGRRWSIVGLISIALCCVACDDEASPADEDAETANGGNTGSSSAGESPRAGEVEGGVGEDAGAESAGENAGESAGEAAGTGSAGDVPPAGETAEPAEPPSCLTSCAEFVGCAIKQCPGYDEPDDALLMEECLLLCTPAIAELFSRVEGCAEQLQFAATVRTDFLDFCDSASEGFCETYIATCGEWLSDAICEDHYNLAPAEGPQPNYGANQRCYEYHLGSAMVALDNDDEEGVRLGCERAAGLAMCIDE